MLAKTLAQPANNCRDGEPCDTRVDVTARATDVYGTSFWIEPDCIIRDQRTRNTRSPLCIASLAERAAYCATQSRSLPIVYYVIPAGRRLLCAATSTATCVLVPRLLPPLHRERCWSGTGSPHRELAVVVPRPGHLFGFFGDSVAVSPARIPARRGALEFAARIPPAATAIEVFAWARCALAARPAAVSRAAHACCHASEPGRGAPQHSVGGPLKQYVDLLRDRFGGP